jgi:hypothetical protein
MWAIAEVGFILHGAGIRANVAHSPRPQRRHHHRVKRKEKLRQSVLEARGVPGNAEYLKNRQAAAPTPSHERK